MRLTQPAEALHLEDHSSLKNITILTRAKYQLNKQKKISHLLKSHTKQLLKEFASSHLPLSSAQRQKVDKLRIDYPC